MNTVSHHSTKKLFALAIVAAVVVLFAALAAVASAEPSYTELCSDCHGGVGAAPTLTVGSTVAGLTSYSVQQSSYAWAAFDLNVIDPTTHTYTRIGGGEGVTGTFTATAGDFVRVCAADGSATGTASTGWFVNGTGGGVGGTISPTTTQLVAAGSSSAAYTFAANSGYHIADVKINGTSNPAAVTAGTYTFTNVQADSTIAVTFAVDGPSSYMITASAGPGGSISPTGQVSVATGQDQAFTITPSSGYHIADVKVDNVSNAAAVAAATYTFDDVGAVHTIAATFAPSVQKSTATLTLSGLKSGAIKLGKTVVCKGAVKPARAEKASIIIQRKSGSKWVKVTTKTANINAATGAYSYTYKPTKKGSYRVQTSVAKTAAYTTVVTGWKMFAVK